MNRKRLFSLITLSALALTLVLSACNRDGAAAKAAVGGSSPSAQAASLASTNSPVASGDSAINSPVAPQTSASSSATTFSLANPTQSNEGGGVTVEVTWKGPTDGPVFTVALNTHSVDLDGYDLSKLAVLRTDQGVEVAPLSWDAPKGGHHRQGTLTFPAALADGVQLITPGPRRIELIIRDVGDVPERRFEWTW